MTASSQLKSQNVPTGKTTIHDSTLNPPILLQSNECSYKNVAEVSAEVSATLEHAQYQQHQSRQKSCQNSAIKNSATRRHGQTPMGYIPPENMPYRKETRNGAFREKKNTQPSMKDHRSSGSPTALMGSPTSKSGERGSGMDFRAAHYSSKHGDLNSLSPRQFKGNPYVPGKYQPTRGLQSTSDYREEIAPLQLCQKTK